MSTFQTDRLKSEIDERIPDLIAMRRDLHEHPELAFEEVRTSGIVAQRLQALGLEVQTGIAKTGVVGLLRGSAATNGTKTLALRADIDALPIHELNDIDYRSQVEGKMHACGHDGHTAILLTVADILSKRRDELKGIIKFVFQPAEERVGGAALMVKEGVLQDVDAIIGLHLFSTYPVGRVGVRAGTFFASGDRFEIIVKGKGGHAAIPQQAVDPIVISSYIIQALQTLISRETSPFSPAVITIGTINAGTAFNIIPNEVHMEGTMRAYSKEHQEYLLRRIDELTGGIAAAMGGSCEVKLFDGCPPCTNDPTIAVLVQKAAIASVGEQAVDTGEEVMQSVSDDMGIFLNTVPGCYFLVGANNPEKGAQYPHHHARFNIDEDSLPIGVEVLTRAALDFLDTTP
jgi:amidohydrolase